ncbi:MAG: hypothetical protein Q7T26_11265 [Dehalococcoidia bacterium]|nr:hypothetical protein [Dehalococcoidia bacterium]
MQKKGVPTVSLVTEEFVSLFKSAARSLGYPDLPTVVVPHPFETLPKEKIKQLADEKYAEIVSKVQKAQTQKPQKAAAPH